MHMIRRRNPAAGALAAVTIAMLSSSIATADARAQTPGDSVFALPGLLVTATRVPVDRDATTAAVTVITGEELTARGYSSLADALRGVTGVTIVQTGPAGGVTSLFLRGGESDYVRVLIDGVPVNDPGGAVDLAGLSVENIERIEVVRGPTSVLYGSDAVTGVIQVFTRQGGGRTRLTAEAGAGNQGTFGWRAGAAGGAGPAAWSLNVAHDATDGTFTSDGAHPLDNSFRNTSVSASLRLDGGPRQDGRVTVLWSEGAYRFPTDGAGQLVRDARQVRDRLVLGLEAGRYLTDRLEARVALSRFDMESDTEDRPARFREDFDYASTYFRDIERRSAEVYANYHLSDDDVVTLGASFETQHETSLYDSESTFGDYHESMDAKRTNRAVYAQLLTRPAERLDLQAGVRVEGHEAFGTHATYRLGSAVRLAPNTRIRVVVGTAFKEPSFIETSANGGSIGNPDLEPEKSLTAELAVHQNLADNRIELAATWFVQRFRDLVQYTYNPDDPLAPNYFNVAGADADGLELEARVLATRSVALSAAYTYTRTRVTEVGFANPDLHGEGTRLLRRPTHAATLDATYRAAGGAAFTLGIRYVGERDDLDFSGPSTVRAVMPAYTRVDASVQVPVTGARGVLPATTLTARVENLFDANYEETLHFPAPARRIVVGARLTRP